MTFLDPVQPWVVYKFDFDSILYLFRIGFPTKIWQSKHFIRIFFLILNFNFLMEKDTYLNRNFFPVCKFLCKLRILAQISYQIKSCWCLLFLSIFLSFYVRFTSHFRSSQLMVVNATLIIDKVKKKGYGTR